MEMTWHDLRLSVNMPADLTATELDEKRIRFTLKWEKLAVSAPVFTMVWSMPLIDVQYEWYPTCRFDRSLRADWQGPVKSQISSSAPVYCFYNGAARNRFTIALSDVYTQLGCTLGVREEDGMLLCRIEIPLDATGDLHEYVVTLYRDQDDVSFAEVLRRVSDWWERDCGLSPMPVPEVAREAMYSTWYSYHHATVAADIEAECARAAALGFKTVIMDDGWETSDSQRGFTFCGDWEACPEKIPDMRAHVEKIHALGMKYMLWYSVPFMGYKSKHWDTFKGKLLYRIDRMGVGVLDPRYPEVRQYLVDTYLRALKDWNLDGFKLDFIDSFNSGHDPLPVPTPEMDYTVVEDAVNRLMTDVMKALRTVKPDILIEFRQSYIGPAMRTFGNIFRVGDCPADPLSNRVGSIDLRLLSGNTAVHSDMLMWHKDDRAEAAARQILSVIFAVPQISVRLDEITPKHKQMLTFWLDFLREHRALLGTSLEVEAPYNLFPIACTKKDGEAVIALYDGGRVIDMPEDASTVYVLNATPEPRVTLADTTPRRFHAVLFDCTGCLASEAEIDTSALATLAIPESGMALLTAL